MISRKKFESIKSEYGFWGSWAVWADEGSTPKSHIGDLSIFSSDQVLETIKSEVVLVGLNISRNDIDLPWANFHSSKSKAQEYKLRYALKGTPLWGAYMTDIIKDFDELDSKKVIAYLKQNPDFEKANIDRFLCELKDIGSSRPTIVALGNATHKILLRNIRDLKIVKITHFSARIAKEKYRQEVLSICSAF
jgi:hypothetical protein